MLSHRIGHYQVERIVGQGAMGVIYLGRDTITHQEVALKKHVMQRYQTGAGMARALALCAKRCGMFDG